MSGLIAVHVGAGFHSRNNRKAYKKLCKRACRSAVQLLEQEAPAHKAVTEAVAVLEDSTMTNAGIGSNLTIDGRVECDASIMEGENMIYGSVGALYGIQNPVRVAHALMTDQCDNERLLGKVPPCSLVGEGCALWANSHGIPSIDPSRMITANTRKKHATYSTMLRNAENASYIPEDVPLEERFDTVGALCVDALGNVCSAVSSGGLWMKCPGRVGQAASYGCGCWAQNGITSDKPNIAVTTSGTGEQLMKTLFAKECYTELMNCSGSFNALSNVLQNSFLKSPALKNDQKKLAGVLALIHSPGDRTNELLWAHTTKSFIFGYMSTTSRIPYSVVSELPDGLLEGTSSTGSGIMF